MHCLRAGEGRARAPSGSTASARRPCSTRPSSRARASSPTCSGWPTHRRGARRRARARVWISPERARWAREDRRVVEELQRRRGDRRAALRRRTSTWRARSSRRPATPSCSSPRTRARRCSTPPRRSRAQRTRSAARQAAARSGRRGRDQITHDRRRAARVPRRADGSMQCATIGPNGRPHLCRSGTCADGERAARLDLRQVAEGEEPRARPARHARDRGRRPVPGAARRDDGVRRGASSATRSRSPRSGSRCSSATPAASSPEVREMVRAQAQKRVGPAFTPTRTVTWDHRKLGGTY